MKSDDGIPGPKGWIVSPKKPVDDKGTREWDIWEDPDGYEHNVCSIVHTEEPPIDGVERVIEKRAYDELAKQLSDLKYECSEAYEDQDKLVAENKALRKELAFWQAHGEVEKRMMKLEAEVEALKKERDELKEQIEMIDELSQEDDYGIPYVQEVKKNKKLEAVLAETRERFGRCKEEYAKELAAMKNQLSMTNSNWPHEKKLHEELAGAKAEIAELQASRKRLSNLELEALKEKEKCRQQLASAQAEVEQLQIEVVKRNQYKINQEYLDNTHAHYEKQLAEAQAEIKRLNEALFMDGKYVVMRKYNNQLNEEKENVKHYQKQVSNLMKEKVETSEVLEKCKNVLEQEAKFSQNPEPLRECLSELKQIKGEN